jgi:hypothetical protein
MGRILLSGAALFAAAAVAVLLDSGFGLGLGFALLGITIGGVLGLVQDGTTIGRLLGYLIGVVVVVVAYLGRVLVGNSSGLGLLAGAALIIGLLTIMATLSKNWLPLWAGLLGAVTVVGAYEAAFEVAPQNILSELLPEVSTALVPVALAFLATVWFSASSGHEAPPKPQQEEQGDWFPWQEQQSEVSK